jgi:DNA-binding transcriptional LysR family regulator
MELSQLRALLALKETCSLAKAGEYLHLSSSAVFSKIRQLEDETGQKLYERIGRRLELTDVGRLLAERAASMVKAHDAALEQVRETGGQGRATLRLGSGPHSSMRIVPALLQAFLAAYPRTDVRFHTSDDQALLRDLRIGLLDAVLMTLPVDDAELGEIPLWRYEMVFVLPPAKKPDNKRLKLEDLRSRPFILYRRSPAIDAAVRQFCRSSGFDPNVVMENDQPDSIKAMVQLGLGIAVLPYWSVGDDCKRGALRILRPQVRQLQPYGVLYRRSEYRPKVLDAFVQVARQWGTWWPLAPYVEKVEDVEAIA